MCIKATLKVEIYFCFKGFYNYRKKKKKGKEKKQGTA
jgi:hypothetical protein